MINKDSFWIGFIPGLIAPFAGGFIFYLLFFRYMYFENFIRHISNTSQWISVLSLGVILNLGLFFLFYQKEKDRSAKGVLAATFIYAFIAVYFKAF